MEAVCYKHGNVAAVTKCALCARPICRECIVNSEGAIFCSQPCAQRHKKDAAELHHKIKAATQGKGLFATLLPWILIAAVGAAAAEYFGVIDFVPWL